MNVRTTCPDCGDIYITHREVVIIVPQNNTPPWLAVVCQCNQRWTVAVATSEIKSLLKAGSEMRSLATPAEADEAHPGPPVCLDDLIDLHFELNDTAKLEEFFLAS